MSVLEKHLVKGLKESVRIYDYLPGKFNTISSRKGIKKAFKREQILCNGLKVNSAAFIKNDDEIVLQINDFQPKNHPSVSVGDVVRYNGERYKVEMIGFKKV